jgi:hypothetical protein
MFRPLHCELYVPQPGRFKIILCILYPRRIHGFRQALESVGSQFSQQAGDISEVVSRGTMLIISEHSVPPNWVFALATFLCMSGVFLHYVSDAQKFFVLRLRKGLIQDGLFARTRNPNYLGEVLIYGGFAVASWHWQPALVLAGWFLYFESGCQGKILPSSPRKGDRCGDLHSARSQI